MTATCVAMYSLFRSSYSGLLSGYWEVEVIGGAEVGNTFSEAPGTSLGSFMVVFALIKSGRTDLLASWSLIRIGSWR